MRSHPTHALGRSLAAFVLSLVCLSAPIGAVDAQVDPAWDHYKVYVVSNPQSDTTHVTLRDQFGVSTHRLERLERFANPVEKRHGAAIFPIQRLDLHYTWRSTTPQTLVGLDLDVVNQFGEQAIIVDRSAFLLSPALKNEATDVPLPIANHYQCYTCRGDPVNVDVFLTDQFFARGAVVGSPQYFCAPVEKRVDNGAVYPIVDPEQTYVVYDIPGTPLVWTASVRDQFGAIPVLTMFSDNLLMVPTDKLTPTPAANSTWGRLKSQYR